jgi:hypothetical protein
MLADAILEYRNFWGRPPVVTSFLIHGFDHRRLVLICVHVFFKYYGILCCPQIVTRTAGSIASIMGYQDWRHHPVPSSNYTNQHQVSWGAKFKFLLNLNFNNFIIEHTTETKILLLVPLDHRNIFQTHWANLKSPDLAFKQKLQDISQSLATAHFAFSDFEIIIDWTNSFFEDGITVPCLNNWLQQHTAVTRNNA